jgi:L-asparaginase
VAGTLRALGAEISSPIELTTRDVADVDSTELTPAHWTALVDTVAAAYDDHDAFVVTHGTNTMASTCAALSFGLGNLAKPVIVTGSHAPLGIPGSDATINLGDALRVATLAREDRIAGVVCVFGRTIIPGTRVTKHAGSGFDAVRPRGHPGLGRVGATVEIDRSRRDEHHRLLDRRRPLAATAAGLHVRSRFDPRVLSLTELPGTSPDTIDALVRALVEREPPIVRGLVLQATGTGGVASRLWPCLEDLRQRGVPVVVTAPAGADLTHAPAIPARDMTPEAATAKLMWLLAQDLDHDALAATMAESLHGEIGDAGGF